MIGSRCELGYQNKWRVRVVLFFSIFSRFITLSTACCVRMVRVSVMLLHRRIKFNNLLFILLILRVHHTMIRVRLNNATTSNLRGSGCSPEDIGKILVNESRTLSNQKQKIHALAHPRCSRLSPMIVFI